MNMATNNIYPDIQIKAKEIKQTESSLEEVIIEFITWVRIKHKEEWYEMMVANKYKYHTIKGIEKEAEFVINISKHSLEFNKKCVNASYLANLTNEYIKEGIQERVLRKSKFPYSEEIRLYIKAIHFNGTLQGIL